MKLGKATILPWNKCLNCKKALDSASAVDDTGPPSSGDITICINCGHIMIFNKQLRFRKLTDREIAEVAGSPLIIEAQKIRERFLKWKKGPG